MLSDYLDTCLRLPEERVGIIFFKIGIVGEELPETFVCSLVVMVNIVKEFLCFFQSIYKGCLTHTIQIIQIK